MGRGARGPKSDQRLLAEHFAGRSDLVPAWYAEPGAAERLHTDYFTLLWQLEYGGFSERYEWFTAAWALEAQSAGQRAHQQARNAKYAGMTGGPVDPHSTAVITNAAEAA